jgi:hypothetical protein
MNNLLKFKDLYKMNIINSYRFTSVESVDIQSVQTATVNDVLITFNVNTGYSINIDWGDGSDVTITGNTGVNQNASSSYSTGSATYDIKITGDLDQVTKYECTYENTVQMYLDETLKFTNLDILNLISVDFLGDPDPTTDIPSGITELSLGANTGTSTGSFDFSDFPSGLTYLWVSGNVGFTFTGGTCAQLPSSLTYFRLFGTASVLSGNLTDLPSGLQHFETWYSAQTFTGDVSNLPSGLTKFLCQASSGNNITGDFSTIPSTLTQFILNSTNSVYGTLADIQTGMTVFNLGNTSGTWSGNFNSVVSTTLTTFNLTSTGTSLTVAGDIADLDSDLTVFNLAGSTGSITGSVVNLPSSLTSFVFKDNTNCTITGNVSNLPSTLTRWEIEGNTGVTITVDTSSYPAWANTSIVFRNSLSSTEVDNFLITWANTAGSGTRAVYLDGTNAARTTASDSAVSTLEGLGKIIYTN